MFALNNLFNLLRKTIAILLLCIFVFNFIGYFIVFESMDIYIKEEMEEMVKNKMNENEMGDS